jgi:Arc/MetJ-type ribon-helix-helix transcriptional regulator
VDLGQIDLLVQEGFYSHRTDFIRTAIRTQLVSHAEVVKRTVARKTLVLGLAGIAEDVSPELALATIDAIEVLGAFRASAAVKAALATRIR